MTPRADPAGDRGDAAPADQRSGRRHRRRRRMSGIALAMSAMCEQAQVPFISTEGAAGIVSPVAQHRWSFKSTVDDDLAIERLAIS